MNTESITSGPIGFLPDNKGLVTEILEMPAIVWGYTDFYRTGVSHYCGYIRIPEDSVFHNAHYYDKIIISHDIHERLFNSKIGKRSPIEVLLMSSGILNVSALFDVHGSITFSGTSQGMAWKDEVPEGWYYGFDCHHCDDTIEECNVDYVLSELIRLAEQLVEYDKLIKGDSK